jgi:uncharacterized damage-inducible protein DinB
MDFQKELIAEFDRETAMTRKMLEAVPADTDFTWKPHSKSMSLGRLAGHISELGGEWAVAILTQDKMQFAADHKFEPYLPADKSALMARFEKETAETRKVLTGYTPAMWDGNWKFIMGDQTYVDESKYCAYRNWVLNHLIHHRAQLGVYLRLLDKPLPGTYGPSADGM